VGRFRFDEFQGWLIEQGWGDGLADPPTAERVKRMLAGTRREPEEIVAVLVPRLGRRPSRRGGQCRHGGSAARAHAVILAAVEALADPSFKLQACRRRPSCSPLLIVNGPSRGGSG